MYEVLWTEAAKDGLAKLLESLSETSIVYLEHRRGELALSPLSTLKQSLMTTRIKLPLRSLNEAVVRDLQEKYPDAEISVEVHQDQSKAPLSERRFWETIPLKN